MANKRVKFTFPPVLITEPVIHNLGQNFEVVTNIRRADVREEMGWVVLEITGDEEEIERSLGWVTGLGVRVDPVSGDVIEG